VTRRQRFARSAVVSATLLLPPGLTRASPPDVPAVLTHPDERSRAELARVVKRALGGAAATLADDALTADGTLVIQRATHRDAQGRPLDGRELGRPERFRLVRAGARCVLVHERTGRRWRLASATCSPR
jgi:hypothetical protein